MNLTHDEKLFIYEAVSKRALELVEYQESISFKMAMELKHKFYIELTNG